MNELLHHALILIAGIAIGSAVTILIVVERLESKLKKPHKG